MITVSATQAKASFGQLIDKAQDDSIVVKRRGKAVAIMLSPQDFYNLQDSASTPTKALVELKAWLQQSRTEQQATQP